MPNNLSVSLNQSTTPWSVVVDHHGNGNEVDRSPNPQTINWQLNGNAASGSFVSLTDPNPGFAWLSSPPANVFGAPTLSGNGNQLSIQDTNTGASTAGSWTYVLRVNVGGTVYTSAALSIAATETSPWIKNK